MVARGEVWWGDVPEQGRRPYLVLTRNEAIGVLNEVLVAALTTTVRGIPTEVPLGPHDGLRRPCAASLDNLTMVSTGVPTERITTLRAETMRDVCRALEAATACA